MSANSMRVTQLVAHGDPESSFAVHTVPVPSPSDNQVLVKVEGFGLNYADVMARLGVYPDCPPLPAVLGYEVVGIVEQVGENVTRFQAGQRVLAFTRFGGYAEYVVTEQEAVVQISDSLDLAKALGLGTQACTAYFCAEEQVHLFEGDHVLIHAAAGGVGTALVQLAKRRKCVVYGTASSHKLDHLLDIGVDHPIDYTKVDFSVKVRELVGDRGLDVIFDPVGGATARAGLRLLGAGGRIVLFGASELSSAKNVFSKLHVVAAFGLYHPSYLLMKSKSIIAVNMLHVADERPWVLQRVLESVMELHALGWLDPVVGKVYPLDQLAEAHRFLESRQSIGKIAIRL